MSSLNGWKVWILKEPHFGATNFLSNFIFLSYFLVYPEIVMRLAYTSKKCEFWHSHLRGTRIVVTPNFIFSCLTVLKNFISPGWAVQFWILASLFEGIPLFLVPQNFVKFYLIFIFSILKTWSVQRKWLNFEFWRPCLKRIPSFWYPQILLNFIFSWYLHILKISMCLAWLVKKLEFWRSCLTDILYFDMPRFCQILSFFHICQP